MIVMMREAILRASAREDEKTRRKRPMAGDDVGVLRESRAADSGETKWKAGSRGGKRSW